MTTLEKIKELKKNIGIALPWENLPMRWHNRHGIITASLFNEDMQLLFKAFEVMREIAKSLEEFDGLEVDKVFEERMSAGEGKAK